MAGSTVPSAKRREKGDSTQRHSREIEEVVFVAEELVVVLRGVLR